jgi:hypothetical protein
LALPPDTSESFAREVDENLRRDQMAEAAKKYGNWVVGAMVLFLAVVGGYLYWRNLEQRQAELASEQLSATFDDVAAGNAKSASAKLDPLTTHDADAVRATAHLTRAALAMQHNDRKTATAAYAAIAADKALPAAYRDLATVRGTALDFDSLKPDEVIARLQPLSVPGNAYFGSAGEMTGMALLAKGDKRAAGQLFAKIAADTSLPASLRSRAVQVAGSLGIDASASLPASAVQ